MKKIPLLLIIVLCACGPTTDVRTERTQYLVSKTWFSFDNDEGSQTNYLKFNEQGEFEERYVTNANEKQKYMRGTWRWIADDEIAIDISELVVDNVVIRLPMEANEQKIIHFTTFSAERLEGISHHVLDAEDSGFAQPVVYLALGD